MHILFARYAMSAPEPSTRPASISMVGGCNVRIESFPRILHLPVIGAKVCSVPDGQNTVVETCAARRGEHARRALKRGLVCLNGGGHGLLCHCQRPRSNSKSLQVPFVAVLLQLASVHRSFFSSKAKPNHKHAVTSGIDRVAIHELLLAEW